MHDIVIRGGRILDGDGGAPVTGDVAIDGGRIAAVGGKAGPAKRVIDADGLLVTPGWVDVHTHYDGQATWDPILAPSSWHGVTTLMFGNCGVGFAPVRREAATPADIAEMRRLTEEALRAGAFGFTTSRTYSHKTLEGDLVPGHKAEEAELFGIGQAMGAVGAGAFGMNSDFEDEARELAWMTRLSKDTGRPIWFLLTDRPTDPGRWRRLIGGVHKARAAGAAITAQVAGRPVGVILGVATSLNPFSVRPSYRALDDLPAAERLVRLRDPELRRRILADEPSPEQLAKLGQFTVFVTTRWDKMFAMGDPPDYEPPAERSIAAIAARGNRAPQEVAYDYLTEGLDHFLFFPVVGYVHGDHEQIRELLTDPATLLGLSDGGAHCGQIVDAGLPSYMLSHWGRDRSRGPGLPLETLVKMQTSETADFFGFRDRGRLAPGKRADVNVIDLDRLRLHPPEIVHDLPAGGKRLVQRVDGYRATLCAGTPIFENGAHTGALPGRLVRAGR